MAFNIPKIVDPQHCELGRIVLNGNGEEPLDIQYNLFIHIWKHMSAYKCCTGEIIPKEFPWILASSSFSGCLDTMRYHVHQFSSILMKDDQRDRQSLKDVIRHLVNQRTVVDFPLPDTWIHHCIRLALSPLHMACWRQDFPMIQALLRLGADPNALALERMDSSHESCREHSSAHDEDGAESGENPQSGASDCENVSSVDTDLVEVALEEFELDSYDEYAQEELCIDNNREEFCPLHGLSPLSFIALGLRSPPMYSVQGPLRYHYVHDVIANYSGKMLCSTNLTKCDEEDCFICHTFSLSSDEIRDKSSKIDPSKAKLELVTKCIELLISTGANPNDGSAQYFRSALPLDIFIQPPIEVYHASSIARSTQTSVCLRRYNLQANLPYVVPACHVMLAYKAKLSTSFVSLYRWKPVHLDCFAVNFSDNALELVRIVTQLGLFNENRLGHPTPGYDVRCPQRHQPSTLQRKNLEIFIASIVNVQSNHEFVLMVLKSLSIPTIHLFRLLASTIIETSEFDQSYLIKLHRLASQSQLRPLSHSSMVVVLKSTNGDPDKIDQLPLPAILKRRLINRQF